MRENNLSRDNKKYDVHEGYKLTSSLPQKLQEHMSSRMLFLVTSAIVLLPQEVQTPCVDTLCHNTPLDVQKISESVVECMLFFCIALLQKDPLKVKNVVQNGMIYVGLKNALFPLLQSPHNLMEFVSIFYQGAIKDCLTGKMISSGFLLAGPTAKQLFLQNSSITQFFKEASSEQVAQIHKELVVDMQHTTDTQTYPHANNTLAILKKIRMEGRYQTLMHVAEKIPHIKMFVDKKMLETPPGIEYFLLILLFMYRDIHWKTLLFAQQYQETAHNMGFFDPWKALLAYHIDTFDATPLVMLMLYYTSVRVGMSLNTHDRENCVRNKYEDWYFLSAYIKYYARMNMQAVVKNLRQKSFLQ